MVLGLRRARARGKSGDLKPALAHMLELLKRAGRRASLGISDKELDGLRARLLGGDEEAAFDIQQLELGAAVAYGTIPPAANCGDMSAQATVEGATRAIGHAARASAAVARATGVDGSADALAVLGQSPPFEDGHDACDAFDDAAEALAYAVLFLRQRGDVMHTSMSELAVLLSSLAEHEPEAARRLETTRDRLAAAQSVGELEQLRESLVRDAESLVSEAKQRVARSEEAGQLLNFHRAHQKLLELALDNATTMAETDALTGLGNRRALDRAVTELARRGFEVGVVVMDLDHFKKVNDTHGHEAGDQVLQAAANVLRAELRGADRAFRSGGEEFVMLLPSTNLDGTAKTADRVREAIGEQLVAVGGTSIRVTASFGACLWSATGDYKSAAAGADEALYIAKKRGRNQVVTAER